MHATPAAAATSRLCLLQWQQQQHRMQQLPSGRFKGNHPAAAATTITAPEKPGNSSSSS